METVIHIVRKPTRERMNNHPQNIHGLIRYPKRPERIFRVMPRHTPKNARTVINPTKAGITKIRGKKSHSRPAMQGKL